MNQKFVKKSTPVDPVDKLFSFGGNAHMNQHLWNRHVKANTIRSK